MLNRQPNEHPKQHSEELMTAQEVADFFRVRDTTVREWVKSGLLSAVVLPHKHERKILRFHPADIQALLHA
jgi:predicted site-specific integrase-resolvase